MSRWMEEAGYDAEDAQDDDDSDDPVDVADVAGVVVSKSGKALLVNVGKGQGAVDVWIPVSKIHEDSEVQDRYDAGILTVPRWIAEEKDLRYTEHAYQPKK